MEAPSETLIQRVKNISNLITKGKYRSALKRTDSLESDFPNNPYIQYVKVGILIDAGSGLRDENIIRKGIEIGLGLLKNNYFRDTFDSIHYNIANGYTGIYNEQKNRNGYLSQIDKDELQNAKHHFREAIQNIDLLDINLRKQLWTNYGNCLCSLGRSAEGLYTYENALEIDSKFPMAMLNKAIEMKFFADISGVYRIAIYIEAFQIFKYLTEKMDGLAIWARDCLEEEVRKIESLFKDKKILDRKIMHKKYSRQGLSKFEKFYFDFCLKNKLFLNFHIHVDDCEASIVDSVFIKLITPLDQRETFISLAKSINQIKEDYAVARLLLVQSQFKRNDLNRISKKTYYAYLSDYSISNIYVGLLKASFKEAFNILDKIAEFINDYYMLDFNDRIYFDRTNFWQQNGKIRKKFFDSNNISIYALYDIFKDFKSGHYKRIKNIRNALTHRKLIVYEMLLEDLASHKFDRNSLDISYEQLFYETINLLKMTKATIIYLINFVEIEERRKREKLGDRVRTVYIDNRQFLDEC